MENQTPPAVEIDPKDLKEGYVPLIVQKGTHRILMYVEIGMTVFAAYDASLDITVYLRDIYRQQVEKAIQEQTKTVTEAVAATVD